MRTEYTAVGAPSALTANTPKTVLAVVSPAQFGVNLLKVKVSFDGATSTATPPKVELCTSTGATAGTSTAVTVAQVAGTTIAAGFTAATNFTVEPTVLTPIDNYTLAAYGGTIVEPMTQGQEPNTAASGTFALRVTTPAGAAAVNCLATMWFERA